MINKKCKVGKKTLAARRIAAILMTSTLAGTLAAGVPATIQISAASYSTNADYIFECLTKKLGYNEAAACGIMANIRCESTFNPHAWNAGGGSYGLCQWTGGRYGRLQSWCRSNGYDYTTIDGQLAYLEFELKNYYSGVENYLRSVPNTADGAYDAGQYYCYHFEAPASRGSVSHYRGGLASGTFWETYRPAEWYETDGKWRYLKRDGSYHTSWLTIDNKTYYLDENGYRVSGWKTIDGIRYYFDKNGVMATGWVKVDGKNYYFDEEGCLITGLVQDGGDWYLVNQDGEIKSSEEMGDFAQAWIPPSEEPGHTSLASADDNKSASSDNSGQTASGGAAGSSQNSAASAADSSGKEKDDPVSMADGFLGLDGVAGTARQSSDDGSAELEAGTPDGIQIAGIEKFIKAASDTSQSISIASLQAGSGADESADSDVTEETSETADTADTASETEEAAEAAASADTAGEAQETAEDTAAADTAASADQAEETAAEGDEEAAENETAEGAEEAGEAAEEDEEASVAETIEEAPESASTGETAEEEAETEEDAEESAEESESESTEKAADEEAAEAEEQEAAEEADQADEADQAENDTQDKADEDDDAEDAFAAADALLAAAEATDEGAEEEAASGFFNLFDPDTSSIADTLPEIIQEAVSSVRFTLKDNRIPSIKRSEMDDLLDILMEKNLLHAVAKDGKDITEDLEVTFEKINGKDNVYKVTFTAEYQGEKTEFESEVTVTD